MQSVAWLEASDRRGGTIGSVKILCGSGSERVSRVERLPKNVAARSSHFEVRQASEAHEFYVIDSPARVLLFPRDSVGQANSITVNRFQARPEGSQECGRFTSLSSSGVLSEHPAAPGHAENPNTEEHEAAGLGTRESNHMAVKGRRTFTKCQGPEILAFIIHTCEETVHWEEASLSVKQECSGRWRVAPHHITTARKRESVRKIDRSSEIVYAMPKIDRHSEDRSEGRGRSSVWFRAERDS